MAIETIMTSVQHIVQANRLIQTVGVLEEEIGRKGLDGKHIKLFLNGVDTQKVDNTGMGGIFGFVDIAAPDGGTLEMVFEGDDVHSATSVTIIVAPTVELLSQLIPGISNMQLFGIIGAVALVIVIVVLLKG